MRIWPNSWLCDGWLVDGCLTELSAQTGYIVPQEYEIYRVGPGGGEQDKHTIKQWKIHETDKVVSALGPGLGRAETIPFPRLGFLNLTC